MRSIVFDDGELIKAIIGYRRRTGKTLPPGQITGMEIDSSPEIIARLIVTPDVGEKMIVPTSGAELAATMIAYCIDNRIPVPAASKKSITMVDGLVALRITTSSEQS
ncbi:hypothetical protein LPB41_30400 [Thalassospira sp. MA62]|nr:hypothetical protein [Thalassospira sp. MA62]